MSYERVTPAVAEFLQSFPKKKRWTTGDIEHFPLKKDMTCFSCGFPTLHFREGIFQNMKSPEMDYRKWIISYECDNCKDLRHYKYIPPDEEVKFVRVKAPF